MDEQNKQIKSLHGKRGGYKAQLTLFEKTLNKISSEQLCDENYTNLTQRLTKIEQIFDTFNEIQNEIECLTSDESELENELKERESFQDKYFELISKANVFLNLCSRNSRSDNGSVHSSIPLTSQNNRTRCTIKLPAINLPVFDGTFTQWRNFFDSFKSLIHLNDDLTNVQKLTYLKSSLKGEPHGLISTIETTDLNYDIAWDILMKRYDNTRKIINNHVQSILNIPASSRESSTYLRELINTLQTHINCLHALKQPVESWDALLVPIILTKLDNITIKEWETKSNDNDDKCVPTLEDFLKFLTTKQNTLENITQKKVNITQLTPNKYIKSFAATTSNNVSNCENCKQQHFINYCESFLKLDVSSRNKRVRELKLCINCLRKGHFSNECKSSMCKKCNKRHHTLLHLEYNNITLKNDEATTTRQNDKQTNNATQETTNCSSFTNSQTLLSTAIIQIQDAHGNWHQARALLDSASQSNFITKEFCDKINLKKSAFNINVIGIGKGSLNINQAVEINFKSHCTNYSGKLKCLLVSNITSTLPMLTFNRNLIDVPPNIKLADYKFNESGPIDILIGAGIFWSLLSIGQTKQQGITLQKTKLGWIISGELINKNHVPNDSSSISCLSVDNLNSQIERFWQIDEFNHSKTLNLTTEEKYTEDYYKTTTIRDNAGKFIVKIPFKPNLTELGDSYSIALSRFINLEKRFERDSALKNEYTNFMNEYKTLNHMTKVTSTNTQDGFYLPHHCVIKEESETTKLRVVFDGSCKLDSGLNINQVQNAGATLQNDIFSILTKFRLHKYALTGDIAKMYRQIWVHPDHRKYQRILWRDTPEQELSTYELNTVTYGLTAAPFLAIRSLLQVATENKATYPLESQIITDDFYVDDLITGSDNLDQLKTIKSNLIKILQSAGFPLRKFNSNVAELAETQTGSNPLVISEEEHKTLGILWNPTTDLFSYSVKNSFHQHTISKRTILAATAQLYDPLGLLAPVIIIPKLIIQELWQLNLTWDESVPSTIYTKWLTFKEKLHHLNHIYVRRHILINDHNHAELHAFSDASERAYGACIYLKSVNAENETLIILLAAKSRVAPLKNITLPRLELCAALLSAQLVNKFKRILNITIKREYYWCDSNITLSWLKSHPNKWKTYVANRVAEIQNLSKSDDWFHVRSSENPADLVSRGILPNKLITTSLWWHGPPWLAQDTYKSSSNTSNEIIEQLPDMRKITQAFKTVQTNDFPIQTFSSYNKLIRVVANCLRFKHNCLVKKENRIFGPLTTPELSTALIKLILIVQSESFAYDLENLKHEGHVSPKSRLLSLTPFIDSENIIRVGGRLKLSNFNYGKKHPIILPANHHLTNLIFNHEHQQLHHAGPKLLLSSIREKYWPISGKIIAKRIVRRCVKCFRFNTSPVSQLMGNLPVERTLTMYPFHSVGVDYAGPYLIKDRNGRGSKMNKAYVSLFICFSTKALHLELVTDLSTKTFLLAFKRFIARRGKPTNVFSDNGTNFVGANNELKELGEFITKNANYIQNSASTEGINWKFIPPRSPNFGGLWEAGVKSMKYHLKRILCNTPLTYEEFSSLLANVESILNSRPLTPLSSDPNDLDALTPAHFLIGRTFTSIPDPDVRDVPQNRLTRFQLLQHLQAHFWNKWQKEYIHELQQKTKWTKPSTPIEIGSMVLLKEDNLPPAYWRLGRITQLHPGTDKITRVVTVRYNNSEVKRAISKICVLPIEEQT